MSRIQPEPRAPSGATRALAAIAAAALRLLAWTWRVRAVGPDPFASGAPVLGALLHRDFLIAAALYRDRGLHVGVSRSRDGDLVDRVLVRLGYDESARGSSSRGGVASQRALLDRLEAGGSAAVVVDGPRGPAGVPKPGIVQLAVRSKRPIQPVTFEAHPAWHFGSWDRACLPLPFARVEWRHTEPLAVDETTRIEDAIEALTHRLARASDPQ